MRRAFWLIPLLVMSITVASPHAGADNTVLHEPIPYDPADELSLSLSAASGLRPAIQTPKGLVPAPNAERPVGAGESPYGPQKSDQDNFNPDRNTQRPDVLPYDDPFSPSTAPFKRLSAFDAVDAQYHLFVRDPHQSQLATDSSASLDEEQFFADMVVDLVAGQKVRVPTVGPGARALRVRAGVGSRDLTAVLFRDGAENWFIESDVTVKARVVMELAIPRQAFGGDFGTPSWAELPPVPALPPNVMKSANEVWKKIGVGKSLSPHDDVVKLVQYFRGFVDSEDPPSGAKDIYLDLALSKKGVCRHRAFAFLVTSLVLGIPTRLVKNEAHAWVEVFDGRLWRRIDLGGAGRTLHDPLSQNVPYEPPADPFNWPPSSTRGEDLADRARRNPPPSNPSNPNNPNPAPSGSAAGPNGSSGGPNGSSGGPTNGQSSGTNGGPGLNGGFSSGGPNPNGKPDERTTSLVTMTVVDGDAHRGAPFRVGGTITSEGEACGHVTAEIVLRSRDRGDIPIGTLATDERGTYDGSLVLPASVPLGDYDVAARTLGDTRCGRGTTR